MKSTGPHASIFFHLGLCSTALIGALGCDKTQGATPPPKAKTETVKAQLSPQTKAQLPIPPGQAVTFDEELLRVQAVRGLKAKQKVEGLLIRSQDLSTHLKRAMTFERPDAVLRGTEEMLVGLGLVDPDFDLEGTMLALLEENLAGLYEPRLQLMMVREDLPEATKQITLLHELVHALQDQYFDLDEIVSSNADDTDRSSALSCLAEGDATSAMLDGVLPESKTALDLPPGSIEAQFFAQPPKTNAPELIVRSLYAPYIDGLQFVHQLRRRGGFEAVNAAFLQPPISTEQVLHLDKYDSHEAPLTVEVPKPPGADWTLALHDIWGEQSLKLSLQQWMTPLEAQKSAAGWGGDRIVAYERGTSIAVAWDLQMDDALESAELWQALVSSPALEPHHGEQPPMPSTNSFCREPNPNKPGPALAYLKAGAHVVMVGGPFDQKTGESSCTEAQRWLQTLLSQN